MARPRKPTAVLELQGSFKKNPQRRKGRENEPKPDGPLGDPPAWLSSAEKNTWRDLQAQLAKGVAGNSDAAAFATLCRLFTALKKDGIGGRAGLTSSMLSVMNGLFTQFGMTPASRSKISVPNTQEEDNPFAQLAATGNALVVGKGKVN
jgi:phage terminase small subunit